MSMTSTAQPREIILWVFAIGGNVDTAFSIIERFYQIVIYLL